MDSFLELLGNFQGQLYLRTTIPQSGLSIAFFLCTTDHETY